MATDKSSPPSYEDAFRQPANFSPPPPPPPPEPPTPSPAWKHIFAFLALPAHLPTLLLAILAALAVAGLKTVLSVILGRVFDAIAAFGGGTLSGGETFARVARWCAVLAALGAGTWVANAAFLAAWVVFGEMQGREARRAVFRSLEEREMEWFDGQVEGVSSLLVQIETQIRELQLANSQVLGFLVTDIFCSLASLGLALYYSWKLTLVLLATLPLSWLVMTLASRALRPAISAQKTQLARASKHAVASVTAIDLVKVFGGEEQEVWQYLQAVRRAAAPYLTQAKANSFQMGYLSFWIVLLFVIGFWYGVTLVNSGGWSPGAILTTFYATLNAFQSIEAFMPQWLVIVKGMAAGMELRRVCGLTYNRRTTRGKKGHRVMGLQKPGELLGHIELENVSFAYPSNPHDLVLRPSSFTFPAGATTFLVGRSGSGKSTIANLLVRFYAPASGTILLDGLALDTLDTHWLRSNVTLVQQSSILFHDTFFANVALGHAGGPVRASREDVLAACDAALLQSTLAAMPNGLDTQVGPRGHGLSGGQKQRLSLARARLRNPPVLILDEVTSGLDQVSRTLIMEALRVWRRGKTTIIITHDVSQIQTDDFVYVMDCGEVVQAGTRRALVRKEDGLFASLVTAGDGQAEGGVTTGSGSSTPLLMMDIESEPRASKNDNHHTIKRRISKLFRESQSGPPTSSSVALKRTSLGFSIAAPYSLTLSPRLARQSSITEEAPTRPLTRSSDYLGNRSGSNSQHRPRSKLPPPGRSSPNPISPRRSAAVVERRSSIDFVQAAGVSTQASRLTAQPRWRRIPSTPVVGVVPSLTTSCSSLTHHNHVTTTKPTPSDPPKPKTGLVEILRTVWPVLAPKQRTALVAGLLSSIVVGACSPAFSLCFAKLMSAMWLPGPTKLAEGRFWALLLLAVGIIDGVSTFFAHFLLEYAALAWINALRVEAIKHILRQPHAWFHGNRAERAPQKIGEVVDRDAEEMRNILGRFVPIVVVVTTMLSGSMVWAMIVSWKLSLVALAPAPIVAASLRAFSAANMHWESRCDSAATTTSATLTETFLNVRVVRALTIEPVFSRKHSAAMSTTFALGRKKAAFTSPLYGFYQSMNYFLIALVFYYGTLMTVRGELSVGSIIQVVNLLLFSIGTASSTLSMMPQISAAQTTSAHMLAYASLPLDPEGKFRGPHGGPHGGPENSTSKLTASSTPQLERLATPLPVRMTDLVFSYPSRPNNTVLRGVNLSITGGTLTALVGPSGCGKSTLTALLLGLLDLPPRNSPLTSSTHPPLTFAGLPPSAIDTTITRTKLALVPQQPFLFPDTVLENILYALPETSPLRTQANAERAARAVALHNFIASLPEGYRTLLGDGGVALSGGQAQRINIARALARRPLLLVMDEPTSALDGESAEAVRQTVRAVMAAGVEEARRARGRARALPRGFGHERQRSGWTMLSEEGTEDEMSGMTMAIVVATHSREMMRLADRVVMLQDGYVVEEGRYNELVARRGVFAGLVGGGRWQAGGETENGDGDEDEDEDRTETGWGASELQAGFRDVYWR